jgi:hypothetical protein
MKVENDAFVAEWLAALGWRRAGEDGLWEVAGSEKLGLFSQGAAMIVSMKSDVIALRRVARRKRR